MNTEPSPIDYAFALQNAMDELTAKSKAFTLEECLQAYGLTQDQWAVKLDSSKEYVRQQWVINQIRALSDDEIHDWL